jgi:very-short-patch-repair endonuclease
VRRRELARELAARQGGVVSRSQLLALGLTRWQVVAELRARRWVAHHRQTIAIHTGDLSEPATWWSAIFEVGPGAAVDGSTALRAAGMRSFEDALHVSTPKSSRPRRPQGIVVHETRRRKPDDLIEVGMPRVRPPIAAIRAALWARSDRQAALVLAMSVQQRITTPEALTEAFSSVRRHRRRKLIRLILNDLSNGAQSLGEIEFARLCREYGLPEPDRQVRRRGPDGVFYLDSAWTAYDAVVEIEGLHHLEAAQVMADASRQNELTIGNDRVVRIPVIGLRVDSDHYMAQVARLLRAGGWTG